MAYSKSNEPLGTQLIGVFYMLLLVSTLLFVMAMPGMVGADWPGWSSTVFVAYLLSLLLAALSAALSGWLAYAARWGIAVGVLVAAGQVTWSLYDAGERAAFLAVALIPVLVMAVPAGVLLWSVWPRATARELADVARANGWRSSRDLPRDLTLPTAPLPLPVRRPRLVRNVVRATVLGHDCAAFEVRWLVWHGPLPRRRRLAVFLGPVLTAGLPTLQVRPAGPASVALEIVAGEVDLESEEFNRAFEVRAADRRYAVDMLHPRTMQVLLDARPMGLLVDRDVLIGYVEGPLTGESLTAGLPAVARVADAIPGHVLDRWGNRVSAPARAGLRFTGRVWSRTRLGVLLLVLGTSTGLLSVSLACCLAAAAAEANSLGRELSPPNYSVTTLVLTAVVLGAVALCCVAIDRMLARARAIT